MSMTTLSTRVTASTMQNQRLTSALPAMSLKNFASLVFARLEHVFRNIVFDLRLAAMQDFHQSFSQTKEQIEQLLNSAAADRDRLVSEFNRACQPVWSADNQNFDVMARINRQGNIELLFVEA
jgi:hypothetical protein